MALVYLARHVMIERRSAIKILRQDLGMNPSHRERFLREARAVNRINHPNIVEITDLGEDGGLVFLVMEYVEGQSLLSVIDRGPLPCKRAVGVGMQIAGALARAHQLGIIHRDLKPENVLLCHRNGAEVVKLTDFGIAKIIDAPALTFSEQRFGTPGYVAPEYIEGGAASARGDLYALGIVLYEMLTGTLPFDARSPAELFVMQVRSEPIKPTARAAGIPADLEALVMKLIARRPEDRPKDAYGVHDSLSALVQRFERSTPRAMAPGGDPGLPTHEEDGSASSSVALRWGESLAQLEGEVAEARRRWGDGDPRFCRVQDALEFAQSLLRPLQGAGAAVAEHQLTVDRIEAGGKQFRAALGHAIESLSRDRSRERARLEAAVAQYATLKSVSLASTVPIREVAALVAQEKRLREVDADLTFQIESLKRQLDAKNEKLDSDLAEATGKLQGALSAARRVVREIARAREEIVRALNG
jgi:serine/threonine-protein kinase